jgi:hypothetical protein
VANVSVVVDMQWKPLLRRSLVITSWGSLWSTSAHASFLSGEALDTAADVISWVVVLIVPILLITLFWLIHVLPEKIAEGRGHPQAHAIKTLCLLSLAFGGLLWPLAWLWAFTKPVFYKMAYNTDRIDYHEPEQLTHVGAPELAIEPEKTAEALRRMH